MSNSLQERLIAARHALALTQAEVAAFLSEVTRRPCAPRTVQSWEAGAHTRHPRSTPAWAVELLEERARTLGLDLSPRVPSSAAQLTAWIAEAQAELKTCPQAFKGSVQLRLRILNDQLCDALTTQAMKSGKTASARA